MNWFKRKSKEEKIQDLQKEVDKLKELWKNELNSYCKIGSHIFILKGFEVWENQVSVRFHNSDCVEGYDKVLDIFWFSQVYGHQDFAKARHNFIKFKSDLKKIGLKLEKIEE